MLFWTKQKKDEAVRDSLPTATQEQPHAKSNEELRHRRDIAALIAFVVVASLLIGFSILLVMTRPGWSDQSVALVTAVGSSIVALAAGLGIASAHAKKNE